MDRVKERSREIDLKKSSLTSVQLKRSTHAQHTHPYGRENLIEDQLTEAWQGECPGTIFSRLCMRLPLIITPSYRTHTPHALYKPNDREAGAAPEHRDQSVSITRRATDKVGRYGLEIKNKLHKEGCLKKN